MADNRTEEGASAGGDGGFSAVEASDSVAKVDAASLTIGNTLDRKILEDIGKDDTFVDCPDEIENSDSQQNTEEKDSQPDDQSNEHSIESSSGINVQQLVAEIEHLRDMHENAISEKEKLAQEYEEERAVLVQELTHLCYELKFPNEQQTMPNENVNGLVDHRGTWDKMTHGSSASLHEILSELSRLFKIVLEDRIQAVEKVGILDSVVYSKDQEIDLLNAKVTELSDSISSSKPENVSQLYEYIEETVSRILAMLYMMQRQDDQLDGSLTEKVSNIEKFVAVLVEKYNNFVSESNQLRGVMNEVGLEINMIDEIGTFTVARDKILQLGRKEQDLHQNLSNLEDENRKLMEQLEKQRSVIDNLNAEIERLHSEVEQEKNRYANTKEKLSMAVTKGKALVQNRDYLKQLLAEKTSELAKCTVELQEKSTALEAVEKTKELFEKTEKFAASLQESLTERNTLLKKCQDILSENAAAEYPQPADITEKLRWLADENKSLKAISLRYHKVTDALLSFDFPEKVALGEFDARVRWLAESFYLSKEEVARLQSEIAKTKYAAYQEIDNLTTSLLLEIQEKSYIRAELEDLRDNYEACERLKHELAEGREALDNEIDQLTKSISAESQEKTYLQLELENLRQNYETVVQKEYIASLEKHKLVGMLREASGLDTYEHKEAHPEDSDIATIIHNCLVKIKEDSRPAEPSIVDSEIFEKFKSLLYVTDQEMNLWKLIAEEDILAREQVSNLSHELEVKNEELNALKDEKSGMQKSLDQLEDRCALLKEKLSMAVKKGKGLVQERETMKGALNEKNTEIDRLKSELQQCLSKCNDFENQVTKLSLDLERIALLEMEVTAAKEHTYQLEQFLADNNSMLQKVMESIEGIRVPTGLTFEEPVEKIKLIAEYLGTLEVSKVEVDQELRKVKDEAISLFGKLSEAETMVKSLEDALSIAETSKSQLLDDKKELEVSMALLEEKLQDEREKASSYISRFEELAGNKRELEDALSLAEDNISRFMKERNIAEESRDLAEEQLQKLKDELQKENEKAFSHVSRFEELSASKVALEDALSQAEDNVSRLINERDVAVESKVLSEEQLQKLKSELSDHITKLLDTEKTIQSLEDSLAESRKNVSVLSEENSKVQIGKADLDNELKKLREEADSYATKLSEASLKIKSLEGALENAENNMADLVEEKKNDEQEILALTSKLGSCMEELAETHGSIENRSLELSGQLSRLHLVLKDATLASFLGQSFKRNFESLHDMDSLLSEMWKYILETDSNVQQNSPIVEDDSSISTIPSRPDINLSLEMSNSDEIVDSDSILSHIEKLNDGFHLKNKLLADKCDSLSVHMDEFITSLLRRLHGTKDRIIGIMKYTKDLQQQVRDMETDKQRQEDVMVSLEGDIKILLSVCTNATQGLKLNVQNNVSGLISILDLVKLDEIASADLGVVEDDADATLAPDCSKTAERLLLATTQNNELCKLFQAAINKLSGITKDMQEKMKESQLTYDHVLGERDLHKDRISKLEADLKAQQRLCQEVSAELNDFEEKENRLRKREEELSTSLSKVHEFDGCPLSASQIKLIMDKMNYVEVPDTDFPIQDSHDSSSVRKLFHVLDTFSGSQQKVHILSHKNEELQSMIDSQILEIETLEKQVKDQLDNKKDPEHLSKLLELESGLQNIVRKLRSSDLVNDVKVDDEIQLLPMLDKLVNVAIESDSLKSKNEELGAKLLGTQKAVDDLLNKIKLLEESHQARAVQPEIGQETGTSSTQSEISEMQDAAGLGKNNIPPVPSAHVRTLRKGSNDHLVLNIDSDSERLIENKEESDDDKGHVFKSLITSGLIPRQGRTVADRIDGIWVSSSRALMSHPRGRLGLITYWIILHVWLLGTML